MSDWQEQRNKLLAVCRQSYDEQLFAGTSGNLSIYDKDEGLMLITPSSVPYTTMSADELVLMKLDGEIIEGDKKPSSEWQLHAVIYDSMPEVSAVVHTHSPYATSFAVNREEIPVILIEMVPFLGGSIPVAGFALPGTRLVGTEAVRVLGDKKGCLMANHGVVTIGTTLDEAHIRAIYVEDAARIYSLAKTNGPVYTIPDEYVRMMLEN